MAQPTPYTPQTNFAADEAASLSGRSTVRTANLDAEFSALNTTVDQILANLALIQRDDTKLRDNVVEFHTLSPDVLEYLSVSGSVVRGAWLTATAYATKDVVTQGTATYICAVAHTSGTFATDLAAVKWVKIYDSQGVFTPTATITSTTVQNAIVEVEGDAAAALAAHVATQASTSGAGTVGVVSYGASATTRTVADKEMDVVSLFDYGTFDAADKTDIRTRALTRQVGAKIAASALLINALGAAAWCPAGSYNINDGVPITTAVGLTLLGAGAFSNNTLWKKTSNGDAVTLTSQTRCVFKGITLQGTGMSTGNGLVLDGNSSGVILIEDCQFAYFPGRGIYANFPSGSPASGVDYIRNLVLECGATLSVPNAEFRYSNDSRWEGNQFGGKVGGPYAPFGAYHYQCKSSDFGPSNYHWEHTVCAKYEACDYSRFTAQRWEEAQTNGVQFLNMIKWNVTGCHVHTNSKASSGTHDSMLLTTCALATISGGNQFYSFNATNVRDSIQIVNDCNSIIVADNVFSGFTRRPVTWDRSTFAIQLQGNLPTGYAINQVFPTINGKASGVAATVTTFAGHGASSFTEADVNVVVDTSVMATQMRVALSAAPGAGQSITVTLRKNAADTAHTVTITGAATFVGAFQAAVGSEISFAAGDQMSWKVVSSATAATTTVTIAQTTAV